VLSRIDAMLDVSAKERDAFPATLMHDYHDFYADVHEALKNWKNTL
jgi:hypothetical protein